MPYGIGICPDESSASYNWCVSNLMRFFNDMNLHSNPLNVVGDAAPQITVMQRENFPLATRTICWAHVWRNISKLTVSASKDLKKRN